ncbi:MAG: RNA polymerase sigma factor [Bacteroidetes bacterium]|nr:RNA polymerase sigma factor [Bacteroidota bacterium]
MYPFSEQYDEDQDRRLVQEACAGKKEAIEGLIRLHQRFIYNVALKLVRDENDAADLTQEVLIKMLTKLNQYEHKSSFRTWLYRIVMNHFLNSQRKRMEKEIHSFHELGKEMDELHNDEDMTMEEQTLYSRQIVEVRNRCMASTLLCLDRQQRSVLILGAIFNLKSTVAAPLLDVSPENFRKQLSRAKQDLFQFMENKCGLMDPANPCRCHKKARGFMKEGKVDARTGTFTAETKETIGAIVGTKNHELDLLMEGKYLQLFTQQPYEETEAGDRLIELLLMDKDIRHLFELN